MSSVNDWPMVKLGDLGRFMSGGTPNRKRPEFYEGSISWISSADISDTGEISSRRFINEEAIASSATKLVPAHTILIATRIGVGKAAITSEEMCFSQDIVALVEIDETMVSSNFLKHMILITRPYLRGIARGVTIRGISISDLQRLEIPLPPMSEQQRIAEILDTIFSNLASRKTQLEQLSILQNSTFERFHLAHLDQATKYHFQNVVPGIDSGKSPVCESRPAADNEWGVLKLSAVTTGEFLQDENKAYLEDTESLSHLEIQPGDLLMTRKNTPELVGAVSLVRETRPNLLFPDLIFRLNLNKDLVKPEYLAALLMSPPVRFSIRSLAGGSAKSMSNISKQRLNKLLIDLPPLNAQREFVTKSQEIQAIKRKINSANKLDQELLASLQAHAFAGQL